MAEKTILMKTDIKCHEVKFEWEIQNALEALKTIHGEVITIHPKCKVKFKSALKVVGTTKSALKLSAGFMRADRSNPNVTVIANLKMCDSNNIVFTRRISKFVSPKCCKKYHWCISKKFCDSSQKLNPNKVINYQDSDINTSTTASLASASDGEVEIIKQIVSGLLIIRGNLKIYGCCVDSNVKAKPSFFKDKMFQETKEGVISDLDLAYETNLYADVILKVADCSIRAHKFILSARCPIFRRLFSEDKDADIEIEDIDKNVFGSFIRFLYTGKIGTLKWKSLKELYSVADKYEVMSLKNICSHTMINNLKYSNACDVLQLANTYNDDELKLFVINYITDNLENHTVANEFANIVRNHPELASGVLKLKSLKNIQSS